jgi:hypothetical protein
MARDLGPGTGVAMDTEEAKRDPDAKGTGERVLKAGRAVRVERTRGERSFMINQLFSCGWKRCY